MIVADLTAGDAAQRWPRFVAAEAGSRAVHALPMRCRDQVIGELALLHRPTHA